MKNLIFALFIHVAVGKVDFCEDHQLPESKKSSRLQFTKETSAWEYAVDSKFKSLHCCAKGYLSIEWFKDGKAYPWPGDVSTYIIYPESENQTIYTKSLKASDAGNYSCRITRENDHLIHNTELIVFDSTEYMEKPLSTYKPPEVSTATFGQETRLFCEAFVGHIDLPDAASEVTWVKNGKELVLENERISIERVQRENGQIVGAYLNIKTVLGSDLGTYTCTISNTGDQNIQMETELKAYTGEFEPLCFQNHKTLITFIFLFPFASFLIFYFYMFFIKREDSWSRVWVKVSEMAPFNKKNQHKSGLVIIYSENDESFMEETFFPQLRELANLYIFPQKINYDVPELTEETKELCTKVQKTVIILSRNLTNEWSSESINLILEKLILKESFYQIVLLEALPEMCDSTPFFRHLHNKLNFLSWEEAIESGILTFLKSQPVVQRLEHRNSHSIIEFFKKNKNSSEVHV